MTTTPTNEPAAGKKRKWPLLSRSHGHEFATVKVGETSSEQVFHIHRDLLAQASQYFDRALNGSFLESAGTIHLRRHCPFAFEILYQWLYSGRKIGIADLAESPDFARRYENDKTDHSLLWLRLLKLSDEVMISELKIYAYFQLTQLYTGSGDPMSGASWSVIAEVFDEDAPQPILQDYFASVAAFMLFCRLPSKKEYWMATWKGHPQYASMILDRVAGLAEPGANKTHPSKDPKFSVERVFGQEWPY